MARGSKEGKKREVFAIDAHEDPDFRKNINEFGMSDIVKIYFQKEEEVVRNWNLPIELLVFDIRFHNYEAILRTVFRWLPYLINGGILILYNVAPSFYAIFHNKAALGSDIPRKFVFRYINNSIHFKNCGVAGSIFYAEKCEKNTLVNRLKTKLVLLNIVLLYCLYFLYLLTTKLPQPIKKFLKEIIIVKIFK